MPIKFDLRLYEIQMNKLFTANGVTNRTQLNTYINNGSTLAERRSRFAECAGLRFDAEVDDNALKATIDATNPPA